MNKLKNGMKLKHVWRNSNSNQNIEETEGKMDIPYTCVQTAQSYTCVHNAQYYTCVHNLSILHMRTQPFNLTGWYTHFNKQ
jgi:hypothetical protein